MYRFLGSGTTVKFCRLPMLLLVQTILPVSLQYLFLEPPRRATFPPPAFTTRKRSAPVRPPEFELHCTPAPYLSLQYLPLPPLSVTRFPEYFLRNAADDGGGGAGLAVAIWKASHGCTGRPPPG